MYLLVDQITEYIIYPNAFKFLQRVHRQGGARCVPSPTHHHHQPVQQEAGGRGWSNLMNIRSPRLTACAEADRGSLGFSTMATIPREGAGAWAAPGLVLSCKMGVKHSRGCVSTLPHSDPGCVSLSDERTSLSLAVPTDKTGTSCVRPLPRGQ